jgi:hypothetical protein
LVKEKHAQFRANAELNVPHEFIGGESGAGWHAQPRHDGGTALPWRQHAKVGRERHYLTYAFSTKAGFYKAGLLRTLPPSHTAHPSGAMHFTVRAPSGCDLSRLRRDRFCHSVRRPESRKYVIVPPSAGLETVPGIAWNSNVLDSRFRRE